MDASALIGPAVVAAVISAIVAGIGMVMNTRTARVMHREKLDFDREQAERKVTAEIALAERKFRLDTELADRKRRQDLAEEVLSGFYRMRDLITEIRGPFSFELESVDRPRSTHESEAAARQKNSYYAPLARYHKRNEEVFNLRAKRYRMVAWFGPDAEQPFRLMDDALNDVLAAAHTLLITADTADDPQADRSFRRQMEAKIWAGASNPDPVADKVAAAIQSVEAICRPALEAGSAPSARNG